jgi:hypothetical protein
MADIDSTHFNICVPGTQEKNDTQTLKQATHPNKRSNSVFASFALIFQIIAHGPRS